MSWTHKHSPAPFGLTLGLLLLLGLSLSGCDAVAYMSHVVGGGEKTYQVDARYKGLQGHRVAVLVAAGEQTLFRYPRAPSLVRRMVSSALAQDVPNVKLMDPEQVGQYQRKHPYWFNGPRPQLLESLGVDRLVVIDLADYQTHERGNKHVWQGVVAGSVAVYEAEADDPYNAAFRTDQRIRFPEDRIVGVVNSDAQTIRLGMLTRFARQTARLFHDHEITK